MKGVKMNWNTILIILAVLMLSYLGLSMMIGATGDSMDRLNQGGEDPKFGIDLGNKVSTSNGDMVGMYSANITGGIKLNYPWPLRDGPGWNVDLNA